MKNKIMKWWDPLKLSQKIWIIGSTLAILLLGLIVRDTPVNLLIGVVGMFYVAVYGTGTRWAFLLGVVYVSLYTIICLENRVMLDALQNIILIPLYIASFIRWGKKKTAPKNLDGPQTMVIISITGVVFVGLYGLSKALNGNYSMLDSLNTTCTLAAMVLGYFGSSLNWAFWTINNIASAVVFGLALSTPTGSLAVFAMKVIFCVNGLFSWYNWYKEGKKK